MFSSPFIIEALQALVPNCVCSTNGDTLNDIIWLCDLQRPTDEEIIAKCNEISTTVMPLEMLRAERDELLIRSDWRMVSDYPFDNQEEWRTYRQALRDLPQTQTPSFNENYQLVNVNWPTPPTS